MVRIRLEIEKNTLFGTTLVRIRSEIEKNTLFGRAKIDRALVRIRSKIEKIEKKTFLVGLWLGLGQI